MSEDGTILLRPVGEDDVPALTGMINDPAIAAPFQWFGWQDPARMSRNWAENGMLGPDGGRLAVVDGTGLLGLVSWRKIETAGASHFWNIGIILFPEARGRGVGTEAQRLLVRYLFAHTPVMRIEADTEVDNIAEQRSLEKAGFTREGVLRSVVFRDGAWRDGIIYGIVRGDLTTGA
ncbi:GNAT family N-acetyltransferase [Streptomyces sp. NPDC049040]|uniref:GNAT family N-acetyltransferase n=1 Tax=Streptomyces sp. NPDC049040 TaxID=3365593 RepID=UPI0037179E48